MGWWERKNGADAAEEETRALVEGALPPWARSPGVSHGLDLKGLQSLYL